MIFFVNCEIHTLIGSQSWDSGGGQSGRHPTQRWWLLCTWSLGILTWASWTFLANGRELNIYNEYRVFSQLMGGVCSVWCGHLLREVNSGNFFFELCGRVAFLLCVEEEVKNLNSEQFSNSSVFQVLELTLIGLLLPLIVFSLALFTKSWPISPLYSIYIQKKVRDQNKMSQTHLKSFNGRQWGKLQSISGVSGA